MFLSIHTEGDFIAFNSTAVGEFLVTTQRDEMCHILRIIDDSSLEENESFYVTITNTLHVQSSPEQLTSEIVIIDNDSKLTLHIICASTNHIFFS